MKRKKLLFCLALLVPLFCFSQNIVLQNIDAPGQTSIGEINGAILKENIMGPKKVTFSGDRMILQKEEAHASSFGIITYTIDKLPTFYSGKIFSPGIIEAFVFENKTPEELILLEITVYPNILEQPYSLFIDLIIRTSSKPISSEQSDDAGEYTAKLKINLSEI